MQQANAQAGQDALTQFVVHSRCRLDIERLALFNHRIHHVGLASGGNLFSQKRPDFIRTLVRDAPGHDGRATGRKLVEDADIQVAVKRERQRARNRGGGHDQRVRFGIISFRSVFRRFFHQLEALQHAEAMLLIYDDQSQFGELYFFFDQGMRPDHKLHVPASNVAAGIALALFIERTGEQNNAVSRGF